MTSLRTADVESTENSADLGTALRSLGDSMSGLSDDMEGLRDAVAALQASTDQFGDRQRELSEQMARTADGLDRDAGPGVGPTTAPDPTIGAAHGDD